jgi:hypothetical protein
MREFLSALGRFRRRLNARIVLRAIVLCLLCFVVALHLYYMVWMNASPMSRALVYFNIGLRVGLALTIIALLLMAYQSLLTISAPPGGWIEASSITTTCIKTCTELKRQNEAEPVLEALSTEAVTRLKGNRYKLPGVQRIAVLSAALYVHRHRQRVGYVVEQFPPCPEAVLYQQRQSVE